ncbi:85/88 kDa calcium-independent phospholipase A2 [Holothuria leucospilota]|uniref:phospholipase A2 n=1 Tax=Holothuria leucospilota TaxID=206669 RepID=A0A9Q1BPV5_HOLLE|nr:85/88 kDa calcium-independent phospholipase A2 [Holothuria leucospilota]
MDLATPPFTIWYRPRKKRKNITKYLCDDSEDDDCFDDTNDRKDDDVDDDDGDPDIAIYTLSLFDFPRLLGEILSGDKSQGFARCSKYIGTALHWVKSVDALMLLLKSDVELNARSRTGDTALHIMIKRQRMDCCLQLLIAGADADICDNEGNSPLHTAAMLNNVDMVRALIAFNADVNGFYAPAIKQTIEQLLAIWEENHRNRGKKIPVKRDRLLCLDGGGSRGYTMDECRRIFFRFTQDLFKGTKPYSGQKLEKFAKELFGETKLVETEKPKILIASCLSNRTPPALHFFRSYTPPPTSSSRIECYSGEYEKPPRPANADTKWRALRSSTAAPTFFPPEDLFMDGGLIANNPTCDAMTEISEYYLHQRMKGEVPNKLGLVVSLGTGNGPVDGVNDISVYVPNGVTDIYKAAQTMKAAANLGTIFVNLITDGRFRPTDRVRAWCDDIGAAFFRLSPTLGEAGALDDTDPARIIKMMWETQVYIHDNMETIEKIGELINKL